MIGSPNNVYYKTDDKIKIHNPSPTNSSNQRSQDKSDFYYNYVNFGMVISRVRLVNKCMFLFAGYLVRRAKSYSEEIHPAHELSVPLPVR